MLYAIPYAVHMQYNHNVHATNMRYFMFSNVYPIRYTRKPTQTKYILNTSRHRPLYTISHC